MSQDNQETSNVPLQFPKHSNRSGSGAIQSQELASKIEPYQLEVKSDRRRQSNSYGQDEINKMPATDPSIIVQNPALNHYENGSLVEFQIFSNREKNTNEKAVFHNKYDMLEQQFSKYSLANQPITTGKHSSSKSANSIREDRTSSPDEQQQLLSQQNVINANFINSSQQTLALRLVQQKTPSRQDPLQVHVVSGGPSASSAVEHLNDLQEVLDVRLKSNGRESAADVAVFNEHQQMNFFATSGHRQNMSSYNTSNQNTHLKLQDMLMRRRLSNVGDGSDHIQNHQSPGAFIGKRVKSQQKTRRRHASLYNQQNHQTNVTISNDNTSTYLQNSRTQTANTLRLQKQASSTIGASLHQHQNHRVNHNKAKQYQQNRLAGRQPSQDDKTSARDAAINSSNKISKQSVLDLNKQIEIHGAFNPSSLLKGRSPSSNNRFEPSSKKIPQTNNQIKIKIELTKQQNQNRASGSQQPVTATLSKKTGALSKQQTITEKKSDGSFSSAVIMNSARHQNQIKELKEYLTVKNNDYGQASVEGSQKSMGHDTSGAASVVMNEHRLSSQESKDGDNNASGGIRKGSISLQVQQSNSKIRSSQKPHLCHHQKKKTRNASDSLTKDTRNSKGLDDIVSNYDQFEESKPNFVVQSFQNKVLSMVQRKAKRTLLTSKLIEKQKAPALPKLQSGGKRRSGGHNRRASNKVSIEVNPYDNEARHTQNSTTNNQRNNRSVDTAFEQQHNNSTTGGVSGVYQATSQKQNQPQQSQYYQKQATLKGVKDELLQAIESPIMRIKPGSTSSNDQKFSTQKRQNSNQQTTSIESDGGDVIHGSNELILFPTVPEDPSESKLQTQMHNLGQLIKTNITVQEKQLATEIADSKIGGEHIETYPMDSIDRHGERQSQFGLSSNGHVAIRDEAGTSNLKPQVKKLEENVLKERQAIFKKNQEVKRKLEDTQSLVQRNQQQIHNQDVLSVQNVKLLPRQLGKMVKVSRGQSTENVAGSYLVTFENEDDMQGNSPQTATGGLGRRTITSSLTNKVNTKTLTSSGFMKSYASRDLIKKRIQATEKFNKDFNEPIQIRQPSVTLIKGARLQNKPQKSMLLKSLNSKPAVEFVAAPPEKSSTDMNVTEDGSVSQLRTIAKRGEKESRQHIQASINSSQMLSTSRNDSVSQRLLQISHEPLSVSNQARQALDAEDLYLTQQNSLGHRQNHIQQPKIRKSLVYLKSQQTNQYNVVAAGSRRVSGNGNNNRYQNQDSNSHSQTFTHQRCSCPPNTHNHSNKVVTLGRTDSVTKENNNNTTLEKKEEKNEHAEYQSQSLESDLMLTNPYNLTEIEKERLKEKNHQLISQFQNSTFRQYPFFLGGGGATQFGNTQLRGDSDMLLMQASNRFGGGKSPNRRSSIESTGTVNTTGTLYNTARRGGSILTATMNAPNNASNAQNSGQVVLIEHSDADASTSMFESKLPVLPQTCYVQRRGSVQENQIETMQQSANLDYAQSTALQKASAQDSKLESDVSSDAVVNLDNNLNPQLDAGKTESQQVIQGQPDGTGQVSDFKILVLREGAGQTSDKDAKDTDQKSSTNDEAKQGIDSLNSHEGESSPIVNPVNHGNIKVMEVNSRRATAGGTMREDFEQTAQLSSTYRVHETLGFNPQKQYDQEDHVTFKDDSSLNKKHQKQLSSLGQDSGAAVSTGNQQNSAKNTKAMKRKSTIKAKLSNTRQTTIDRPKEPSSSKHQSAKKNGIQQKLHQANSSQGEAASRNTVNNRANSMDLIKKPSSSKRDENISTQPENIELKTIEKEQNALTSQDGPTENNPQSQFSVEVLQQAEPEKQLTAKQIQQLEDEEIIKNQLSVDKILAMDQSQIATLNFRQIRLAQQVIYQTLSQMQVLLCHAFLDRTQKSQTQNSSATALNTAKIAAAATQANLVPQNLRLSSQFSRSVSPNHQLSSTRNSGQELVLEGVQQPCFTTNYERYNLVLEQNTNPPTSAFSREQQEMRRKWIESQRMLEKGIVNKEEIDAQKQSQVAAQQIAQKLQQQSQQVKIKLVGEPSETKSKTQIEVENYYKYKRRQVRQKIRKERIEKQNRVIDQCSTNEFLLLAKINFLMQQQNLLVSQAKEISMQDLFNLNRENGFEELKEKNEAIEEMEECKANLQKFNMMSALVDSKHIPAAQRLASRQTLHRVTNRTGDKSNATNLILAAHEKLNHINRQRTGGSSAKPDPPHRAVIQIQGGGATTGNSYSLIGSSQPDTMRYTQSDARIASGHYDQMNPRLSHHGDSSNVSMLGDAAQTIGNLRKAIALQNSQKPQHDSALNSTINLYLKEFKSAEKVGLGSPELLRSDAPSTQVISPYKQPTLNLKQLSKLTKYVNSIGRVSHLSNLKDDSIEDSPENHAGIKHMTEFIIGQKSVAKDSAYEQSIDTMRKLPASASKHGKETAGGNTYETHPDKHDDSLQHSVTENSSPIDKFSLVYQNQQKLSPFNSLDQRKRGETLKSSSEKKIQKMQSKESSISNSVRNSHLLGKSPSMGLQSIKPSKSSLNSDIDI